VTGYWHKIEWGSPYSEPPAGAPRVLAETYTDTVSGRKMLPATTLGGGYSIVTTFMREPGRKLSPQSLARVRRKRLERRVLAKAPLFAEQLVSAEIARKADYYAGITDERIEAMRDEEDLRYAALYERLEAMRGIVMIYADEPAECGERARMLLGEFEERKGQISKNGIIL
jgi:hypothetical protein